MVWNSRGFSIWMAIKTVAALLASYSEPQMEQRFFYCGSAYDR
jgi:hypothetical protein